MLKDSGIKSEIYSILIERYKKNLLINNCNDSHLNNSSLNTITLPSSVNSKTRKNSLTINQFINVKKLKNTKSEVMPKKEYYEFPLKQLAATKINKD